MLFTRDQILAAVNDPQYRGRRGEPFSYGVGGGLAISVGANNPFVIVRAAKTVALEINQIAITGDNAGGLATEYLRLLAGRTYDAFTGLGAAVTTTLTLIQGGATKDDALGGGGRSSIIGNSTTTNTLALSGRLWRTFAPLAAHLWSPNQMITLARPIVIFGDDPGGIPVVGCFPSVGNLSAGLALFGREWPFDTDNY